MGRLWELVEDLDVHRATVPASIPVGPIPRSDDDDVHHLDDDPSFPFSLSNEVADHPPLPSKAGAKRLGAFATCLWCGSGTWVRLGGLPTCPSCSRSSSLDRTSEQVKAHLWRLLDLWAGMDESQTTESVMSGQPVPVWTEANIKALYEDILDLFSAFPKDADRWFREWRQAHPEARLA
jgi:hypothetical protein